MLIRQCAGGVVFYQDKVLLLQNDKKEWTLPKGVIRNGDLAPDVAVRRVKEEAGVEAAIVSPAGQTSYEFYSYSRQRPVCNQITWYIMRAAAEEYNISSQEGFLDGGFFPVEQAIEKASHNQEKSLICVSYKRLTEGD